MKWRATPSARCAEHGLTLGKDGRCALCRRSPGRAARRSGWAAALAVFACALAGAAIVGGRAVSGAPAADARATAAAARPSAQRRPSATERAESDLARGPSRAHTGREAAAVLAETSEPEASDRPPASDPEPGGASAEDRSLRAPVRAPLATRRPAPAVPDAPAPLLDTDEPPARDDPSDFERPAEGASRPPWAPPL